MGCLRLLQTLLSVLVVVACVPKIASATLRPTAVGSATPKSFAVFVMASNEKGEAKGGVAGTAFFVDRKHALTAYHVLQPKSFELQNGFTRQRVWLVHEGERAIELKTSQVQFDAKNDATLISLDEEIAAHFVYESDARLQQGTAVQTEGFRANTAGPTLARVNGEIEIVDVPHLERVNLSGSFVSSARIELRAADVTLESTPCLQVSYEPIRGISGGPLLVDGRVVGINSFGDPSTAHRSWAVALNAGRPLAGSLSRR